MGYGTYEIDAGPLAGQMGGYNVTATCGHNGCEESIDRGMDHMCGDNPHGGDEDSCGLFFCADHLEYVGGTPAQRCTACAEAIRSDPETLAGHCHLAEHPVTVRTPDGFGRCACGEVSYGRPPTGAADERAAYDGEDPGHLDYLRDVGP